MPAFNYIALDNKGRRQKGVIEADSIRQTRNILRERLLTPVSVLQTSMQHKNSWLSNPIRLRDLAEITRQLAILVQSGLPVEQALQTLSRQSNIHVVKTTLASVRAQVMEGKTLAESLAFFPASFSELFCMSVAAGERTGHLDIVLGQLADFIESSYQARQKIILALLYPAILTVVSLIIILFLMAYIVPDMIKIFTDTGHALPALTRALITTSNFIQTYGLLLMLLFAACGWFLRQMIRRPAVRMQIDKNILRLPVAGLLVLQYASARFASTLGMLQESGVALVSALDIAAAVVGNQYLRVTVRNVAKKVSEGTALSKAMEQTGLFPPVLVTMAASGEASGKLGAMLIRSSLVSQRETDNRIAILIGLFEPMILLLMGGMVLLLVLAIILPILNLNKLV